MAEQVAKKEEGVLRVFCSKAMTPVQVEDFPAEVEGGDNSEARPLKRSSKGALHLRPGSVKTMTEDEFNHVKESRPELVKHFAVLEDKKAPASAKKKKAPKAAPKKAEPKAAAKKAPAPKAE